MNKSDLVEALSEGGDLTKTKAKAPKRVSDSDAVLAIIRRYKKGVDGAP